MRTLSDRDFDQLDQEFPYLGESVRVAVMSKRGRQDDQILRERIGDMYWRSDNAGRDGDEAMWAALALKELLSRS